MFSTLEKLASGCTVFMAMRRMRDGFFDDEMRRRFGLILPHVRRALLIGKVIELHKVKAVALADSLDTLASGMFIVDGTGRIVHANASGYAMLAESNALRAPGGRLWVVDLRRTRRCWISSRQLAAAMRCSAGRALPCR